METHSGMAPEYGTSYLESNDSHPIHVVKSAQHVWPRQQGKKFSAQRSI